jgi:hypothetical protein
MPEGSATKATQAVSSPITIEAQKNDSYVSPPVVLGDGHMLQVILHAPGKITSIDPFRCDGLGCGWTHHYEYRKLSDDTWAWIGWSNSGQNCLLSFTVHFQ